MDILTVSILGGIWAAIIMVNWLLMIQYIKDSSRALDRIADVLEDWAEFTLDTVPPERTDDAVDIAIKRSK